VKPEVGTLINIVGTAKPNAFFDVVDSKCLDLFELNVMGGVRAALHYMPKMMERGWAESCSSAVSLLWPSLKI
jgi:short-subunit dehydrogenase